MYVAYVLLMVSAIRRKGFNPCTLLLLFDFKASRF